MNPKWTMCFGIVLTAIFSAVEASACGIGGPPHFDAGDFVIFGIWSASLLLVAADARLAGRSAMSQAIVFSSLFAWWGLGIGLKTTSSLGVDYSIFWIFVSLTLPLLWNPKTRWLRLTTRLCILGFTSLICLTVLGVYQGAIGTANHVAVF